MEYEVWNMENRMQGNQVIVRTPVSDYYNSLDIEAFSQEMDKLEVKEVDKKRTWGMPRKRGVEKEILAR